MFTENEQQETVNRHRRVEFYRAPKMGEIWHGTRLILERKINQLIEITSKPLIGYIDINVCRGWWKKQAGGCIEQIYVFLYFTMQEYYVY